MENRIEIRIPVGNGVIYPKDRLELETLISAEVAAASAPSLNDNYKIKAIVVPSIAYKYSIKVLADVYKHLEKKIFDEIFMFSDPVMHSLDYLAFAQHRYWETPVASSELSHRAMQIVRSDDNSRDLMKVDDAKHLGEISIEAQLPFLEVILKHHFKIIPFMHGHVSPRLASSALIDSIDQDDLLVCITSLSAGLPDEYGVDIDKSTINAIKTLDLDFINSESLEVTSPNSLRTLCTIATLKGWKVKKIGYEVANMSNANRTNHIGIAGFIMYE